MEDIQDQFRAVKRGDLSAFESVFRHYYQDIYRQALRIVGTREVAEELVQDLFVHLWENRRKLVVPSSPKAYLFTAIRNRSFTYLKSRMARSSADLPLDSAFDAAIPPASHQEEAELQQLIRHGINELPEKCRIIFQLSREMGMSYGEIARELDVSRETVKSQIQIALKKLRQFLGNHWDTLLWVSVLSRLGCPSWISSFDFF